MLWDVFPSGAHLGGAPFNFAASCARLGHEAVFLTAVGDDALGESAVQLIAKSAVSIEFVQVAKQSATGTVRVEFDSQGQPDYTIVRPAAYDFLSAGDDVVASLAALRPAILYFGTLSQMLPNNRDAIRKIVAAVPGATRFYDVNLRRDSYSPDLLRDLMPVADIVKFNDAETDTIQGLFGTCEQGLEAFCRSYSARYGWRGVCVTRGPAGCVIQLDGDFADVPGFPVAKPHPVGAGDAFSAAFCHGISQGWPAARIGDFANRVGAVVTSRTEAVSDWTLEDCYRLSR